MLNLAWGKAARFLWQIYRVCAGLTESFLLDSKKHVHSCCIQGTSFCSSVQRQLAVLRSFIPLPHMFNVWPDGQKAVTNKCIWLCQKIPYYYPTSALLSLLGASSSLHGSHTPRGTYTLSYLEIHIISWSQNVNYHKVQESLTFEYKCFWWELYT